MWDDAAQELLWVDILARRVNWYRPADGSTRTLATATPVGAVAQRRRGGLVLALEDGVWLTDADAGSARRIAAIEADRPETRANDGKCDPSGRFWVGTMGYGAEPGAGSLYRVDPDGVVTRAVRDVTISNGLAWHPGSGMMYYIDSTAGGIDAFTWDAATGELGARRRAVEIERTAGVPDGMTIDREGCLWVALYGGWSVHRYTPEGRLDRRIEFPVSQVTSCTFGGEDMRDLYVTSARNALSQQQLEREPLAGGLFRVRLEIGGFAAHLFAG